MYSFEEIKKRSASDNELVVGYVDALELLQIFEEREIRVLGWEGWIRYPHGALGHSVRHQGTADLSRLSNGAAITLIRQTIMQSNDEWKENPESSDSELLFCITTSL